MAYVDIQSIHNPATGLSPPASWADQIRDDLEWLARNHPHCRINNNALLPIADSTTTALTFNSERVDVGGMHSTVSNTSRIVIPAGGDGWFNGFGANLEFSGTAAGGYRQAFLRLNGATSFGNVAQPGNAVAGVPLLVDAPYQVVAGDYVEVCVLQTSGGPLNVVLSANSSPEAWATWDAL